MVVVPPSIVDRDTAPSCVLLRANIRKTSNNPPIRGFISLDSAQKIPRRLNFASCQRQKSKVNFHSERLIAKSSEMAQGEADAVVNQLYSSPGFEFLHSIRHHFAGRVQKTTPSGRQQSAVLVIVPECLVLCSNRGGFHTAVMLEDIVAATVYPRGKFVLHIRGRHELLLTAMHVTRVIAVLQHLLAGQSGRQLPIHHEDKPPVLDQLRLRPDISFVASVPHRIVESFKRAAMDGAGKVVADAHRALVDPQLEAMRLGAAEHNGFTSPQQGVSSGGVSRSDPLTSQQLVEKQVLFSHIASSEAGGAKAAEAASTSSHNYSTTTGRRQADGMSGTNSAARRKELDELSRTLTILIVRTGTSVITFPGTRSLWLYLSTASKLLPGCQQAPTLTVQCVDAPLSSQPAVISVDFIAQVMGQFAREKQHTVTLQKTSSGEGHHFDAHVFWTSMLVQDSSLGSRQPFQQSN